MNEYVLSHLFLGLPFIHGFEAPDEDRATWYARGFISDHIGRDPESFVSSRWRLDRQPESDAIGSNSLVGICEIEKRGDDIGQHWKTVLRRRPRGGPDMNVGDPHDDPPGGFGSSSQGQVLKRASGGGSR